MQWLVIMMIGISSVALASPGSTTTIDRSAAAAPQWAVGYQRGTGRGYAGASVGTAISPRLAVHLQVFGLPDEHARGVSFAPVLELYNYPDMRLRPYLSLGPQYHRVWFGEGGSGGGFGGHVSVGLDYRWDNGISIQAGLGLHLRQDITADDGMVSTTQRGMFGPHWDVALRYWFSS